MATALAEESDDLTNCPVCLDQYNRVEKQPKSLPFCVHTLCISCLKDLQRRQANISCPLCRKEVQCSGDVTTLPTNNSTLHIIKLKEKMKRDEELSKAKDQLINKPKWCVTCNSAATINCSPNKHLCVDMTTGFMKNLEVLLSLKDEMAEKNKQSQVELAAAIEKKKECFSYSQLVSEALLSYYTEHTTAEDQCQISLAELTSLQQRGFNQEGEGSSQAQGFTQLLSLLSGTTGEKNAETFRQKMDDNFFQPLNDKVKAALIEHAERVERGKKSRFRDAGDFKVEVFTQWPKDVKEMTPHQRDSLLLSHFFVTMKNRVRLTFKKRGVNTEHASSSTPPIPIAAASQGKEKATIAPVEPQPISHSATASPTNAPTVPTESSQVSSTSHTLNFPSWGDRPKEYWSQGDWRTSTSLNNSKKVGSSSKRVIVGQINEETTVSSPPSVAPPVKKQKTNNDRYRFGIQLWSTENNQIIPLGTLLVVPLKVSSPYSPFIEKLMDPTLCTRSTRDGLFDRQSIIIDKVVPGVFILLQFLANSKFTSLMTDLQDSCVDLFEQPKGGDIAKRYGDVGITKLVVDRENRLAGWSFLLPLDYFRDPVNAPYLKGIPPAFLLGCFRTKPRFRSVMEQILSASKAELHRCTLSMYLEKY